MDTMHAISSNVARVNRLPGIGLGGEIRNGGARRAWRACLGVRTQGGVPTLSEAGTLSRALMARAVGPDYFLALGLVW